MPNPAGGNLPPEEAEKAWQACRKGAEGDMGRDALARRFYRLDYVHDGRQMKAVVGEREPDSEQDLVMAIIAFTDCYKICCQGRGYMELGAPIVGTHDVRYHEDFA